MAKELPYFQFEPAEYLTKDISFCSLSAQGLFINVCSYYWQRQCKLTKTQFIRRLNHPKEFDELVSEGVIDLKEDIITIKFLDALYENATKTSKVNSINGSKGGRPRKEKPKETETKPKQNPIESETKGIREDKIKEDKIIGGSKEPKFNFSTSLLSLGIEKDVVEDWIKVRRTKKATNSKTAFDAIAKELELVKGVSKNEAIKLAVVKSWAGFKAVWVANELDINLKDNYTFDMDNPPPMENRQDYYDWQQERLRILAKKC